MASNPTARLSSEMKAILRYLLDANLPVGRDPISRKYAQISDTPYSRFVPWQPWRFIGENPTPSARSALSERLKKLEDRGLVKRYQSNREPQGARVRTAYVVLTRAGRDLALLLILSEDELEVAKREERRTSLEGQIQTLYRLAEARKRGGDLLMSDLILEEIARSLEKLQPYIK